MKFLGLCLLVLGCLVQDAPASLIELQISGGKMALPGQFPYQVLVRVVDDATGVVNKQALCSGALIDPHWVVTAASCLSDSSTFELTLGAFDLTVDENTRIYALVRDTIEEKRVIVHEAYNATSGENDIALLKLGVGVVANDFVAPIRLPSKKQAKSSFWLWNGSVSGWGFTKIDDQSQGNWVLRWFDSRVQPNFWCQLFHGWSSVRDSSLCLSSFWKKGACVGDAGDPVAISEWDGKATLIGIASNDTVSCGNHKPSLFTRITSHLDWISKTASIELRE